MKLVDATKVRVDYLVRDKDSRYKIIDIVVEGVSLLSSHRAEFGEVVGNSGVEGIIKYLEQKTSRRNKFAANE